MVLEEEYEEAKSDSTVWTVGFLLFLVPMAGFGACLIAGSLWAVAPTAASSVAWLFCWRGRTTCARIIKRFRDQQRLALAERELTRDFLDGARPGKLLAMAKRR